MNRKLFFSNYNIRYRNSLQYHLLFYFFSQVSYAFTYYGAILPFYNTFIYASLALVHLLPFSFLHAVSSLPLLPWKQKSKQKVVFYWGERTSDSQKTSARSFFRPNYFESTVDSVLLKRLFRYLKLSDAPLARSCYNGGLKSNNLELPAMSFPSNLLDWNFLPILRTV